MLALVVAAFLAQGDPLKERATLLRAAKKPYAEFVGADPSKGTVSLRLEPDGTEVEWPVDPEAELRVRGWWGGREDFVKGDRVWVWARPDRDGKPKAVFMLADEVSEQDIHQVAWTLAAVEDAKLVLKRKLDPKGNEETRELRRAASLELKAAPGAIVYVRSAKGEALEVVEAEGLYAMKRAQKERLEARWKRDGVPGTVGRVNALVGELELVVDHEAMRPARSLKPGDKLKLRLEKPVAVVVGSMHPWNERTKLALIAAGRDLADLRPGTRARLGLPDPDPAADGKFPPDMGRPRDGADKENWFLASTYCTCSIAGDG
jgi:hypothetical protein